MIRERGLSETIDLSNLDFTENPVVPVTEVGTTDFRLETLAQLGPNAYVKQYAQLVRAGYSGGTLTITNLRPANAKDGAFERSRPVKSTGDELIERIMSEGPDPKRIFRAYGGHDEDFPYFWSLVMEADSQNRAAHDRDYKRSRTARAHAYERKCECLMNLALLKVERSLGCIKIGLERHRVTDDIARSYVSFIIATVESKKLHMPYGQFEVRINKAARLSPVEFLGKWDFDVVGVGKGFISQL